ncbi:hypothetical protein [Halorubellus salinus]|uniref:hypothetical protein n=1 Tax=Halorubellus salinus TaxID=755309 RepID=UPI001D091479|nr:hypothetical protein [Halorubellus salinus]
MNSDSRTVPLTVDADLDVEVNGDPVAVTSTEDRVFLEFPSVLAFVRAARRPPAVDYRPIDAVLRASDLAVEVRVRHRTVAALGADTRPSLLLRRLGIDPMELRLAGAFSAVGAGLAAVLGRARDAVSGLR